MKINRRHFIQQAGLLAGAATLGSETLAHTTLIKPWFEISLAEWSLHKTIFNEKKLTNLDFPVVARKDFDIGIVEYVNQMFKDKAKDTVYLNELLQRCRDHDVRNHLIMIDGEGGMAEPDEKLRSQAIENHKKWVECAKYLGCTTIRVNAYGKGTAEEVGKAAADGLAKLGEFAAPLGINVVVENHGGYSSNGQWLSGVMRQVNMVNVGTLPDFGNFCIKRTMSGCDEEYDRYQGVKELMPYAKGVSAKTNVFDDEGNEANMDYERLLKIVKQSGFRGIIGIEYEGNKLSEYEGIKATKRLLERAGATV
ncbi:MAG: sugar phosphate isomerase/epimerase family protein [Runella sp.]